MRQEVTRMHKGWSLDTVTIDNVVLRSYKDDIREAPAEVPDAFERERRKSFVVGRLRLRFVSGRRRLGPKEQSFARIVDESDSRGDAGDSHLRGESDVERRRRSAGIASEIVVVSRQTRRSERRRCARLSVSGLQKTVSHRFAFHQHFQIAVERTGRTLDFARRRVALRCQIKGKREIFSFFSVLDLTMIEAESALDLFQRLQLRADASFVERLNRSFHFFFPEKNVGRAQLVELFAKNRRATKTFLHQLIADYLQFVDERDDLLRQPFQKGETLSSSPRANKDSVESDVPVLRTTFDEQRPITFVYIDTESRECPFDHRRVRW